MFCSESTCPFIHVLLDLLVYDELYNYTAQSMIYNNRTIAFGDHFCNALYELENIIFWF